MIEIIGKVEGGGKHFDILLISYRYNQNITYKRKSQLIFADGNLHEQEKSALSEIIKTFKEDGIDLKISLA
jgi:acid stress-induced BolA-like protein IbaG/YrbA